MSDRNARRLRTCLWTALCLGLLLPWGAQAAATPAAACAGTDLAAVLAAPAASATAVAPFLKEPVRQPAAGCPLLCRSEYSSCLNQCNVNPYPGCTTDCYHQYQACLKGAC